MIFARVYRGPCVITNGEDDDSTNDVLGEFCKAGPDIVEPLLTNVQAVRLRGKNEIDFNSTHRVSHSGVCKNHTWQNPGQLVSIQDTEFGELKGKLVNFAINISRSGKEVNNTTSVNIEREGK